ncbi:adenosylcobinamide-GDP ribazoletransferase [Skermania sp. ID1734]|uniref:adenosylcobinamide-GDP ribazoletransferase n=1 Tax=Skermania sp. ID1734 TaxID=2597516 RepID=UPI00117C5617|nr:adenosylcobinamide-GDP ribazoletransferase [Skermania sp. ID1734]TSE01278.1 adenosylcobinamide-GDP ribazoletransferase [Skermania sp. ID1734]
MRGLLVAFSWLTVAPLRMTTVEQRDGARAMGWVPVVGAGLGALAAALMWALHAGGLSGALAGLLTVGVLAVSTRGMHLDGLADTADGLGCYGPPERARAVMLTGDIGPFGAAALVFAIGIQALSFAQLGRDGSWALIAVAVATGRVAATLACRRGSTAAPDAHFGALVAGTQPVWLGGCWAVIAALVAGVLARPWWQGVVVVVAALVAAELLVRHCNRRFGGISGDVLGAAIEFTVTATAVGFTFGCA